MRTQNADICILLAQKLEYSIKSVICAICIFDAAKNHMDAKSVDAQQLLVTCFIMASKLVEHEFYEARHVLKMHAQQISEHAFETTELNLFAMFDYSLSFHDELYDTWMSMLMPCSSVLQDQKHGCEMIILDTLKEMSSLDPRFSNRMTEHFKNKKMFTCTT